MNPTGTAPIAPAAPTGNSVQSIIANYKASNPPPSAIPASGSDWYSSLKAGSTPAPSSGFHPLNDIADAAKGGIEQMKQGYQDAQNDTGLMGKTAAGMKEIAGGLGVAFSPLAPILKPTLGAGINYAADKLSNTPLIKGAAGNQVVGPDGVAKYVPNTEADKVPEFIGNTSTVLGTAMGSKLLNTGISKLLESKTPSTEIIPPGPDGPSGPSSAPLSEQIKASLGKSNIDPRLETSAKRLENPSETYSTYAKQAKTSMGDVKADSPISSVGSHIGDAYDQVIKTRQSVGANMAEELAKVKDVPVDVSAPITKLHADVQEGLPKMTSFDKEQLQSYANELKTLGDHPTAGQLDAFLSRVPKELDVAKASKNITDVTNAERIIKGNLSAFRDSLTSQPGMEPYAAARKSYANLSNFLDEGSKYLGAKTQTGDYARDTSIAKSSAESILAGGKKDWLIKLEGLTGYKALDDATMAIQAMKDAGDTRGLSLFKSLTEGGGVPTPHGILGKLTGYMAEKAAGAIVGTPTEQTQAFLNSLQRDLGTNNDMPQSTPMTNTAGIKPKNSQSAPNAMKSNSDIQEPISQPAPKSNKPLSSGFVKLGPGEAKPAYTSATFRQAVADNVSKALANFTHKMPGPGEHVNVEDITRLYELKDIVAKRALTPGEVQEGVKLLRDQGTETIPE